MSALSLGIDTSNYTTSVALVDENENMIYNKGILLEVKSGERGLRQSDALFQHIHHLPMLLADLPRGREIEVICYSKRPRPLLDSYMPVFRAGESLACSLAGVLAVKQLAVSHQENHIRAAIYGSGSKKLEATFAAVHFSGGTSEILLVKKKEIGYDCEIIAQTRDLNAGQLIDRIGVLMGCDFPAGKALEALANQVVPESIDRNDVISATMDGMDFHFSGQENQAQKLLRAGVDEGIVAYLVLKAIAKTLSKSIGGLQKKHPFQSVLFSGGVMSNQIIKKIVAQELQTSGLSLYFSPGEYARDNAAGNALMGMDYFKSMRCSR
ncbi:peptidase M22 [Acetobacterium carbinolicum]|jgi:N6-L-threonylcarbamoyladenine synthase|uniref:Kae1-like domain-containing protein n=1 Tax=Acetobacterium TaxID=33951 RepID=UPI000DBEC7AF|nr:peptidase M22 [Acetobacterium sp. KB-1]AWW28222.1 peptidase M22 [Acetobacterium sp. KB-1]